MRFECADCGCIVDGGVVVASCSGPACCCRELPHAEAAAPGVAWG
ncbi:MAG TPA: hypothetical protein VGL20_14090 [Candidatus Dormibacteraeota bacterium]|jgi:hypothetical protein